MSKWGKTGVTSTTPKSILLGAGTIHKGLTFAENAWNFEASLMGATNGGSKITIKPEMLTVPVDGANVATKGLVVKVGETAEMEINFAELTKEICKTAIIGKAGTSADTTFDLVESSNEITSGDYLTNIAFVGVTVEGKNIIIIFDNALCTSGFEVEGKNKETGDIKLTFACHADLTSDLDTLPYHIYFPKS